MEIKLAAITSPGRAMFGTDLLDLTVQAWEKGINLTGVQIRNACPADSGGVWVQGACEEKHYSIDGKIDN